MCSPTVECVLLLYSVFSYCRMCSLAWRHGGCAGGVLKAFAYSLLQYKTCSPTVECVLLLHNVQVVVSRHLHILYYQMCSPTVECVLLLHNVQVVVSRHLDTPKGRAAPDYYSTEALKVFANLQRDREPV